ncbi:hypothetical protein VTI74DRAFT_4180 [Chaetomium olivicolor]
MASSERPTPGAGDCQPPPACLSNGDVFRILGLPDKFIIGLDAMAMTTSKSLPGFRDIPPGAHFLWVQQPDGVSRCGYWFVTGRHGVIHVKQWDKYEEVLRDAASEVEVHSQQNRLDVAYSTLQPYTLHNHREKTSTPPSHAHPIWARSPLGIWNTLASAISTQNLDRITGRQNGKDYFVDSLDSARDAHKGIGELNFLFAQDLRDLQVLDLGSLKSHVADTSSRIQALLESTTTTNPFTEQDMLAELQFTFLTGTHLGNSACLEQWWNLVLKIFLRAYGLAVSRPPLVSAILQTLHAQLLYSEHYVGPSSSSSLSTSQGDQKVCGGEAKKDGPNRETPLFQYKPHNRERLRCMLAEYKAQLHRKLSDFGKMTPALEKVGSAFEELETWLWQLGWDLRSESPGQSQKRPEGKNRVRRMEDMPPDDSEEDKDEMPVVVELDEEGREVGLVSWRD